MLAATSGPVRLYKFMGGPTFTALFATHREEGNLSFQDFGGSPSFTSVELGLFRRGGGGGGGRAETLAMVTEGGVYHGRLVVSPLLSCSLDGLIVEAALNEYVGGDGRPLSLGGRREGGRGSGGGGSPLLGAGGRGRRGSGDRRGEGEEGVEGRVISMVVTEFHFVLLFPKRLQVVSRLNGKQVRYRPPSVLPPSLTPSFSEKYPFSQPIPLSLPPSLPPFFLFSLPQLGATLPS